MARSPPRRRRGSRFLAVVVTLLSLLIFYAGSRLIPGGWPLGAQAGAWGLLAAVLFVPLAVLAAGDGEHFSIALAPVGLFVLVLSFTVLRDLGWLVAWLAHLLPADEVARRSAFDLSSGAAVALGALTFTWGTLRARGGPTVVDVSVPISAEHAELHGFTIAQISDVHIGRTLRRPFLESVVAAVNGIGADIVAITGDLVDGGVEELREHTEPLGDLRAKHGVWFVTGNHDYYSGALPWIDELRRLGLRVLINAHDVIEHEGMKVVVGGVTDHSAGRMVHGHESDPHKAAAGAPDAFKLLLAHQPASAVEAEKAGFHLQLSGHTHGGQFFPGTLLAHLIFPFVDGLHRLGAMWIYTSRGTGWVGPPLRTTRVAGEVTRITLVAEAVTRR